MTQFVDAIYESGLLRPLGPLHLAERERVQLAVTTGQTSLEDVRDTDFLHHCRQEAAESVSLDAVRQTLSKIPGSMAEVVIAERGDY